MGGSKYRPQLNRAGRGCQVKNQRIKIRRYESLRYMRFAPVVALRTQEKSTHGSAFPAKLQNLPGNPGLPTTFCQWCNTNCLLALRSLTLGPRLVISRLVFTVNLTGIEHQHNLWQKHKNTFTSSATKRPTAMAQ